LTLEYHGSQASVDICAYHGKGTGRLLGSSINAVQYLNEGIDSDIYLMGHDHKRGIVPGCRIRAVADKAGLRLKSSRQLFARTGGWLKGYVDGQPSYVAAKALRPVDLGGVRFELTPQRRQHDGRREFSIDIKGIV